MKQLKLLSKIVLALITVLLILGVGLYFKHKPTYQGNLALFGLENKTEVYFDNYGIPHIYAANEHDAMRVLGYVHAQERLWQMELIRRIAPGRLSEIFGEEMLETDRFFATLGIEDAALKTIDSLDKSSDSYLLATAYLDGINQYIDQGPIPIEFLILGINKEHFTLTDIYNTIGFMSFSFAMAHKTDPLLTALHKKLGNAYMNELSIHSNPNTQTIKSSDETLINLSHVAHQVMEKLPVSPFVGSNSWVVNGSKTKSGKVIFANDPHIGFAQPAVWYEAHIVTPKTEIYGSYIAGVPFPLLGHNRNFAYGLTMFENDDIDFYEEELHPTDSSLYRFKDAWKPFTYQQKTIQIKGGKTENIIVKSTHHGPIVSGVASEISNDKPISMFWIYTHFKNEMLDVSYNMSRSNSIANFKTGVSKIHAPGLNVMYGDANGNIAWWATGKLYQYPSHVNTLYFLNGASGTDEINRFLEFDENPQAVNPPWNYVYSANNQPEKANTALYPGYYLPEDRAKRIVQLLETKNDWDKNSIAKMITDVTSSNAPEFTRILIAHIDKSALSLNEKNALTVLSNWDGAYTNDLIAPTIYTKTVYFYLKNTFEDEMGKDVFDKLLNTHFMKVELGHHLLKEQSLWWDNVTTDYKETKKAILNQSFKQAVKSLENQLGSNINTWTWKKVHTIEHQHPFGKIALLRPFFNVGPFEIHGSSEVINNLQFPLTDDGKYKVNAGPSARRIIDFSDIENGLNISPTGQSGNIFSKHYTNQSKMYNKGEFRKMMLNKDEIIANSTLLQFSKKTVTTN